MSPVSGCGSTRANCNSPDTCLAIGFNYPGSNLSRYSGGSFITATYLFTKDDYS